MYSFTHELKSVYFQLFLHEEHQNFLKIMVSSFSKLFVLGLMLDARISFVLSSQIEQGVYSHLSVKIDDLVSQPSQCDTYLEEIEVWIFLCKIIEQGLNLNASFSTSLHYE